MCGICAFIYRTVGDSCNYERKVLQETSALDRRGPDQGSHETSAIGRDLNALFYGTLLHFRGPFSPQPLRSRNGNILLWNGEIFGGIKIGDEENDGQRLLEILDETSTDNDVLTYLSMIEGPWAVIYWQLDRRKLWFGRDVFGRRSLLVHVLPDGDGLGLSSVQLKQFEPWLEVPASGVFCLTFDEVPGTGGTFQFDKLILYPWVHAEVARSSRVVALTEANLFCENLTFEVFERLKNVEMKISEFGLACHVPILNSSLPEIREKLNNFQEKAEKPDAEHELLRWASPEQLQLAAELRRLLGEAVKIRVNCQSHLCNECMKRFRGRTKSGVEKNVKRKSDAIRDSDAFTQSPINREKSEDHLVMDNDRRSHDDQMLCHNEVRINKDLLDIQNDVHETKEISYADATNFSVGTHQKDAIRIYDTPCNEEYGQLTESLSSMDPISWENGTCAFSETVKDDRLSSSRPVAAADRDECRHAKVAILFSGGVDSLVIAALADKFVPSDEPIDLLNVAFEQRMNKINFRPSDLYNVPDRITGRQGLMELQKLNSDRRWNFVEVDVSLEELQQMRLERIQDLVCPLNTVLDDSIGCAVWFAARGRGTLCIDTTSRVPYTSPARIVLVGMGADEQLAGYSRHRVRFTQSGSEGLIKEIQMEIKRIAFRNLGRDDRVISDHSREARIPFLDEKVVDFLSSLPVYHKANLSLPRGVGEKFLLRLCALRLGLAGGSTLQKRAIQFGSRIAKAENHREKANDICCRIQTTNEKQ